MGDFFEANAFYYCLEDKNVSAVFTTSANQYAINVFSVEHQIDFASSRSKKEMPTKQIIKQLAYHDFSGQGQSLEFVISQNEI